jgi:hypothetical protein
MRYGGVIKTRLTKKKMYTLGMDVLKKCVLEIMYNSGKIISFITGIFAIFYSLIPRKIVIYVAKVVFMREHADVIIIYIVVCSLPFRSHVTESILKALCHQQ